MVKMNHNKWMIQKIFTTLKNDNCNSEILNINTHFRFSRYFYTAKQHIRVTNSDFPNFLKLQYFIKY